MRQLYQYGPGPVVYWKLDENTGTGTDAVKDSSGNGNHGTMDSSMTESDWVPGKFGSALNTADNNGEYINAGGVAVRFYFPINIRVEMYISQSLQRHADDFCLLR